jgi:uridylate kinase
MGKYSRILLKLSGESLMGTQQSGIDPVRLNDYAEEITEVIRMGIQVGIVIGGGNIFRGLSGTGKGIDRVRGDQMGMLATVINSLALQSALISSGSKAKVFTSVRMEPIGEYYSKEKAVDALESGVSAIIAGGTGNPFFTTDTAAALRAVETEADVMLKGTRVDGIYSADPEKVSGATLFDTISFGEIYRRDLRIMDLTATTLCRENHLPVIVFNMDIKGNLLKIVRGQKAGTLVIGF